MPQESLNPTDDKMQAPRQRSMQFVGGSIDPTTGNLIAGNRVDAEKGRPGIPGSDEAKAANQVREAGNASPQLSPPKPAQSTTRLGSTSLETSTTRPLIDRGATGSMLGPMGRGGDVFSVAPPGYYPAYFNDERGPVIAGGGGGAGAPPISPVGRAPTPPPMGGLPPGMTNPTTAPIQPPAFINPTTAPIQPGAPAPILPPLAAPAAPGATAGPPSIAPAAAPAPAPAAAAPTPPAANPRNLPGYMRPGVNNPQAGGFANDGPFGFIDDWF